MVKRKLKRKMPDEERYKVSKEFKKWMDSQIAIMYKQLDMKDDIDRFYKLELEISVEAYTFIRGLLK